MGFWLKSGKKYGKRSKLIKKLNQSSHTDEITGMEVWKGLRVNAYDDFVTLSGRYVRDDSEIYSFRFAFEGSAKLKKSRIRFKVNSFVKRSHEAYEDGSIERLNLYEIPREKKKSTLKHLSVKAWKYEKFEASLPVGSDQFNEYMPGGFQQFYEHRWHQNQELFGYSDF